MIQTLLIVLVVLWILGMVSSFTMGGLIHLLLLAAVAIVIFRLVSGQRVF